MRNRSPDGDAGKKRMQGRVLWYFQVYETTNKIAVLGGVLLVLQGRRGCKAACPDIAKSHGAPDHEQCSAGALLVMQGRRGCKAACCGRCCRSPAEAEAGEGSCSGTSPAEGQPGHDSSPHPAQGRIQPPTRVLCSRLTPGADISCMKHGAQGCSSMTLQDSQT